MKEIEEERIKCTFEMSKQIKNKIFKRESNSLSSLCKLFGIEYDSRNLHTAITDALLTAKLLGEIYKISKSKVETILEEEITKMEIEERLCLLNGKVCEKKKEINNPISSSCISEKDIYEKKNQTNNVEGQTKTIKTKIFKVSFAESKNVIFHAKSFLLVLKIKETFDKKEFLQFKEGLSKDLKPDKITIFLDQELIYVYLYFAVKKKYQIIQW